jgi:hypothetical protein
MLERMGAFEKREGQRGFEKRENQRTSRLSSFSGTVSAIRTASHVHGATIGVGSRVSGSVQTTHTASFRVDGKAVSFIGSINLQDGDLVTIVSQEKEGREFKALAIRIDTTGVVYSVPLTMLYVGVVVGIVAGIITLPLFGIGLIGLVVSGFGIKDIIRNKSAVQMIDQHQLQTN